MRVISGSARGTKLNSIDDLSTRPTLDRVKESLFNIINNKYDENSKILDLFAGSGAIGIEFLSRGAEKVTFCELSKKAIEMININLEKTHLKSKANIINEDYKKTLEALKLKNEKFDIIFIDPPYKENMAVKAIELIEKFELLKEQGLIIIETDEIVRDTNELKKINTKYKVYDTRKYGRVSLIFLN